MNYQAIQKLLEQNQIGQVHQQLVSQIKQWPNDHQAYYLLALLNIKVNNLDKAIAILEKCFSLKPLPHYLIEKAKLKFFSNHPLAAKTALKQVCIADLDDAALIDTCGNLWLRLNDYQKAAECFGRAYQLAPEQPSISLNFAICEKMQGNIDSAVSVLKDLTTRFPAFTKAQVGLSEVSDKHEAHSRVDILGKLISQFPERSFERYDLLHALALEHEKLNDSNQAWHHFEQSKKALSPTLVFDINAYQHFVDEVMRLSTTDIGFAAMTDIEPIFVVGMPRSGTSLTEQLLGQLENLRALGESTALPQYLGFSANYLNNVEMLKQEYRTGKACQDYRAQLIELAETKRTIDKLPFNFLFIGLLSKAFPKAKFIFVHRNSDDTVIANFRQHFQPNSPFHQYSFDFQDCTLVTQSSERLRVYFEKLLPKQVASLSYEALVANPINELTRICEFIDEGYSTSMLDFYKTNYFSATASKLQLRKPLNREGITRYTPYKNLLAKAKK